MDNIKEEIVPNSEGEKRYKIEKVESAIDNIVTQETIKLRVVMAFAAIATIGIFASDTSTIIGQFVQFNSALFIGGGVMEILGSISKLIGLDISKRDMEKMKKAGNDTVGKYYDGKFLGVLPVTKDLDYEVIKKIENRDGSLKEIFERWKEKEETEELAETQAREQVEEQGEKKR